MKAYQFNLTCPNCGGDLEHEAGGTSDGWETRAIAVCGACSARVLVHVDLSVLNPSALGKHAQLAKARAR